MKSIRLLLVIALVLVAASAFARGWVDKWGKTYQAKFVRFFDGDVVLQQGNKVLKIPFEDLSEEDQEYVRKQLESKGQAHLLPPKTPANKSLDDELRLTTPGPMRTWTNDKGREIEAQLLGFKGNEAILLFKGREVKVQIDTLSPEDQRYIEAERAKAKGLNNPPPAVAPPIVPAPQIPPPSIPQPPRIPPPSFPQPPQMPPPSFPQPPQIPTPSFPQPQIPSPSFPAPQIPSPSFPQPPRNMMPDIPRPTPPSSWPGNDHVPLFGPNPAAAQPNRLQPSMPNNTGALQTRGFTSENIGRMIVAFLISATIGTVVGAVVLRAACWLLNMIAGGPGGRDAVMMPNFGQAAGVSLILIILNNVVGFLFGMAVGYGMFDRLTALLLTLTINIVAGVVVIASALETTIFKAIVITVLEVAIVVAIAVLIGLFIGGLSTSMMLR